MDSIESGRVIGIIGGVLGALIGVAGAALGTYFSIKNTKSPRERAFMVKVAIFFWIFVIALLAALLAVPPRWKLGIWAVYGMFLPASIFLLNREQRLIRQQEEFEKPKPAASDLE